jgi:glycosyltransferase involved in cell wall biosynthesis
MDGSPQSYHCRMEQIRIHIGYRTTDAPWGGANNFMRALRRELADSGRYSLTESMDLDCDILFMSQLSTGPGSRVAFDRIRRLREGRATLSQLLRGHRPAKARRLVVRAVNLNRHAFRMGPRNLVFGTRLDREAVKLVNFADFVIFQSAYQRSFFLEQGYVGEQNAVIHNGADAAFWADRVSNRSGRTVLRIVSATASARPSKRHDLIARLSELADVEVWHFGNWPQGVDPRRVQRHGMMPREQMAEAYAQCDLFFHPAVRDPCPNAIFEAVCSGLPVLFNGGTGSSGEIVQGNGLPIDEANLAETVARARALLPELKDAVMRNRDYYTVRRAARQYCEVFDTVAADASTAPGGHD